MPRVRTFSAFHSRDCVQSIYIPLEACSLALHTSTSQSIDVAGQITAHVSHRGYKGTHSVVVVKGGGPSLLGRDWLSEIQLGLDQPLSW